MVNSMPKIIGVGDTGSGKIFIKSFLDFEIVHNFVFHFYFKKYVR